MKVFTCPHCGANVDFDPSKQSIICDHCGSEITIDDYKKELDKQGYYQTIEHVCPQCGARILSTDNTVATFCSFCGSSLVLDSKIIEEKKPEYIIPFKISQKQAENIYKKKIENTLLAPDWMNDKEGIKKFRGIYMPFHVFRFRYDTIWSGTGKNTKTQTIRGVEYDVTRTYSLEETPVVVDYDFIPVDASSSYPDSISRTLTPYHKSSVEGFKLPYLAGFYADGSDVEESVYDKRYEAAVLEHLNKTPILTYNNIPVSTKDILKDVKLNKTTEKALFPVWFLSFRNKNRVSYAAINGETGELAVDIPIDFGKYLKVSLVIAALLSVIFNFIITLNPNKLLSITAILSLVVLLVANSLLNDTYRTEKHLDDPGYLGEDKAKIKYNKKKQVTLKELGIRNVIWFVVVFALSILVAIFDIEEYIMGLVVFFMFVDLFITLIKVITTSKSVKVKNPRVPLYYKFFTLAKPILGIVVAFYINSNYHIRDELVYMAGIFAILMIIWTAMDVVFIQNRFTMRDLPLFNEKRGGDH